MRGIWLVAAMIVTAGCVGPGLPVPIRGTVEPLVGEWVGDYSSKETGRSGSIVFTLAAGTDTARGDVMMVPANIEMPMPTTDPDPTHRHPQFLKISFVRCEGNDVTGWLDPYPDPDTGERVSTTFEGTIKGDKLQGTYTSYLEGSNRRRVGTWTVSRKAKPAPATNR